MALVRVAATTEINERATDILVLGVLSKVE